MRRNDNQVLLKYEIVSQKTIGHGTVVLRERVKVLFRCFLLVTLGSFLLLCYAPAFFQVTLVKRAVDGSVEGWGLNTSRVVPIYILPDNETTLILNDRICSEPLPLLIVVLSAVNNSQERLAIRETWGSFPGLSYKVAFLLGTTENITLQERVEVESRMYNDIIQEDFIDSYYNLTLKAVMLLKFVKNHCDKVRYILKTDDDMFIHVQNLILLVNGLIEKNDTNVLLGRAICNAKPIRDASNKWYSPKYMYRESVYPLYLSGPAYLMSREVTVSLYNAALSTPYFHLEDIYITGLCAKKARIKPRFHDGFSFETRPLDPCLYIKDKNVIASHRVSVDNLRHLWAGLYNSTNCDTTSRHNKRRKPSVINRNKEKGIKKKQCP